MMVNVMEKIAVFGAGGFGREIAFLIQEINLKKPRWEIVGFYDDAPGLAGGKVGAWEILGGMEKLNRVEEKISVVVAVGDPGFKSRIVRGLRNPRITFPTLIHPSVIFSTETQLGAGCVLCAGSILTVNVKLEDFVTLNLKCTVGHDSYLGAFSSFMPNVSVSGEVKVGRQVYVGTGANILNRVEIGSGTVVGAGALVNKSLPEYCTAVGVPARIIKTNC